MVLAGLLASPLLARGDSWSAPGPYEAMSGNGQWLAKVTPRTRGRPGTVSVEPRQAGEKGAWKTDLSNSSSPYQVRVADDGACVVTLDNWASVGYGDDVLAFYTRDGLRRKYSLEQVLGRKVESLDRDVPHSVSSRWWRQRAIDVLVQREDGKTVFAIWGAPDKHWLAWDARSGESITPDEALEKQLTDSASRWARQHLGDRDRGNAVAGIRFLGHHRFDRESIERQLASADFYGGLSWSSTGGRVQSVEFRAESASRREADDALAAWDGKPPAEPGSRDRAYVFLGTVRGTVELPAGEVPRGQLYVYLVPDAVPQAKWAQVNLAQCAKAELTSGLPEVTTFVRERRAVPFRIDGVNPGRYWVKVVADSAEPYCSADGEAGRTCTLSAGDYESAKGGVTEVKAGQIADTGTIACTRRFED